MKTMTWTFKNACAAAVAIALAGGVAACEKAKPPAQKADAGMPTKTIAMPAKPLTDAEKSALFKAAKEFVSAAQAKEPRAYTDIDWRTVEFKRMGVYFHVSADRAGANPHATGPRPYYLFRADKEMKNIVELTAQPSQEQKPPASSH